LIKNIVVDDPFSVTLTGYIAAEEATWDYAPAGRDVVMGMDFDDGATVFVGRSADRIGSKYKKAIFVEYTDATFKERKPRPAAWQHLGILGPIIHAQVGDKIRVVFHNKASRPYSIHPHGVFYTKANEGALTDDGTSEAERAGGAVAPESTYVYQWDVPARAGPGPSDLSSVVWPYHSHVDSVRDANTGLVPDDPGIWMFHCRVNDHITGGMTARYEVLEK
jgi:manganese oxidase